MTPGGAPPDGDYDLLGFYSSLTHPEQLDVERLSWAKPELPCGITTARQQQIRRLLDNVIAKLIGAANNSSEYPEVIYNLQANTANALQAAENCRDVYIMNKLATLYAIPFGHLSLDGNGDSIWAKTSGNDIAYEVPLDSTQFMFAVAKLINTIVHTDRSTWTPAMDELVGSRLNGPRQYLIAHLDRWMNKKTVWIWPECELPVVVYKFSEYVDRKAAGAIGYAANAPRYCNAVQEPEIWVAVAATELIDADTKAPSEIGLRAELKIQLTSYIRKATRLLESRISLIPACRDGTCKGAVFDVGAWHGHAGYPAELWPKGGETWDFSHMRRFVQWIDTLYRHPDITQPSKSFVEMIESFSNELAHRVFNGSYANPAFANFWDGSNIPYPTPGKTYGPSELSSSYFRAGYGFWGAYQPEISKINDALARILDKNLPASYMTPGGAPPDGDYDLLGFYSSLTHPEQLDIQN
jgi:hypothetical protein